MPEPVRDTHTRGLIAVLGHRRATFDRWCLARLAAELIGRVLMSQAMRRHAEVALRHAEALHHVAKVPDRLDQRVPRITDALVVPLRESASTRAATLTC